ncbi:MAG: hypothetical protein J7M14_08035, partial [Planctomycetes bacterium]|nr:hypothetical protein [Planctomycetota bacterium]
EIKPTDASVRYAGFPYPIRVVGGRVIVTPESVTLHGISALHGEGKIRLDGHIPVGPVEREVELTIQAEGVALDSDLVGAIRKALPQIGDSLVGGATLGLRDLVLRLSNVPAPATAPAGAAATAPNRRGRTHWSAKGEVSFVDLETNLMGHRQMFSGRIKGQAGDQGAGLAVTGEAHLDRLEAFDKHVTNLHAMLAKHSNRSRVQVRRVQAGFYGGKILGQGDLWFEGPLRYNLSASLMGIELAKLLNGTAAGKDKPRFKGLLTGSLQFTGQAGRSESIKGVGQFRITDAVLGGRARAKGFPVVRELVDVLRSLVPGQEIIDEAIVQCELQGRMIVLREVYLRGLAVSLAGSGTMDLKTKEINLTFLSGPPGILPRLRGGARELKDAIVRELFEVRVTGKASNPRIQNVPLKRVTALTRMFPSLLRRILSPELETK